MIDGGRSFWVAYEFCSNLDRATAKVVAYNIQKLARRSGATLVVATTHTDLEADLCPSTLIRKGWGDEIDVEHWGHIEAPRCTVTADVSIREGSREDYGRLSHLHYRDSGLPVPREIYAMDRAGELVGVIVYSYPPVRAAGRRNAVGYTPKMRAHSTFVANPFEPACCPEPDTIGSILQGPDQSRPRPLVPYSAQSPRRSPLNIFAPVI